MNSGYGAFLSCVTITAGFEANLTSVMQCHDQKFIRITV